LLGFRPRDHHECFFSLLPLKRLKTVNAKG
jgi:hypothetical protein